MPSETAHLRVHTVPALHDGQGNHVRDVALAVEHGRVVAVGERSQVLASLKHGVSEIHEHEGAILPGFVDAHVHVLRAARDLDAVDCRPSAVRSIAQLCAAIRERADTLDAAAWVEAAGYHEDDLAERRHPTAAELDAAASDRPVRLRHRSSHGIMLNTAALQLLHIGADTPDPFAGTIERDASGMPTGLLLGRATDLARRRRDADTLAAEVDALSRLWLRAGITTVCDAGPDNDAAAWNTVLAMAGRGALRQRTVVMRGAEDALTDDVPASEWTAPPELADHVRAGHVKVILRHVEGRLSPSADEVAALVARFTRAGRACAIHAASLESITAAISALEGARQPEEGARRHRIEHASLLPDALLERLRGSGAAVVTHPLFIERHGDRYLLDEAEHPPEWLYRCAALIARGIPVAAGSDAPVTSPAPLQSIAAAMRRRTLSGRVIGAAERVDFATALALHTSWAALVCGMPDVGVLRPGAMADFVVVPADPALLDAAGIAALSVSGTWMSGAPAPVAPDVEFVPC